MKIIDIRDIKMHRMVSNLKGQLREFTDYYEYCFIEEYEIKYDDFMIDGIQIANIFVSILESRGKSILVSVQFPKPFDVYAVVEWLDTHVVNFNERDNRGYFIDQAHSIVEGVNFKGNPIVIASKGEEMIYFNPSDFEEITVDYLHYAQIVNTGDANDVEIEVELQKNKNRDEGGNNEKFQKPVKWIDDTDKDDWIDAFVDGKGYPGRASDRKKN